MKRRHFLALSLALSKLSLLPLSAEVAPQVPLFSAGSTIGFLGDSITAGGKLQTNLANYYLTRFPDQTFTFVNAGRSGDSATGAIHRVEEDLLQHQPNTVLLMLGMNDVGRSNYVANPTPEQLQAQKNSIERYKQSMIALVDKVLQAPSKPKIIFITPSPFDQTLQHQLNNNQPGCNDGLAKCAEFVRELAKKHNAPVIDFHDLMTKFNLEQQKKDPSYTIIGSDRVHPAGPGFMMMTWIILKAQGATPIVNEIEIQTFKDGASITKGNQVKVTDLKGSTSGPISFQALSKALPFPISADADPVLSLLPIEKDLNQEVLRITGLQEGNYELLIEGKVVAKHHANEWAKGINLGMNRTTPQNLQAQEVAKFNETRRALESEALTLIHARRRIIQQHRINPDDREAIQAIYDVAPNKTDYHTVMTKRYLEKWSQYENIRTQAKEAANAALGARQPKTLRYELRVAAK